MNLLDRGIMALAPTWGAQRAVARYQAGLVSGGPYGEDPWSRMRKNNSFRSRPVDEDHLQGVGNRSFLRQQCVDLFRRCSIARAAVTRIADYSTTCQPYPITGDAAWDKEAGEYFMDWARRADFRQRPGVDLRKMVHLSHIADGIIGESFWLLIDNGQIQPIDADRITTPSEFQSDESVIDGIRVNVSGIITHYYICSRGRGGSIDRQSFKRVAANDIIHIADPWRVDMIHPPPRLHAAVQKLQDWEETDEGMRGKVKNEAKSFWMAKSSLPLGGPRQTMQGEGQARRRVVDTDIGQIIENADMELIESKSPNGTYTTHMIEEGKAVAAAYDMPYEYLMGIFTAGSYNAQKGARLYFKDTCTRRAEHRNQWMLQRVWNWRIAKAIKTKELPPAPTVERSNGYVRSIWDHVEWALPRFVDIDLGRDVSAKSAAWAAGQQSLRDNRDAPYQILTDKAEDIIQADRIAVETNKKLQTAQVTWQHIINAGVPGMTIAPADGNEDKLEDTDDEK